jgi:hypothetical protein
MLNARGNIRILNLHSIILLLIVFSGLLISSANFRNSTKRCLESVPVSETISQSSAVSSPGIRLQVFQQIWVLNKDNFDLLAFNRNPLSDDKKIILKISLLQNIRQNSFRVPLYIFSYHLFPSEMDEPPLLS